MALSFFEASKPYMMPGGGTLGTGEIAGLDPTNPANAVAIANGTLVASGAPGVVTPVAPVRVQFKTAMMVGGSPPLYDVGDIAGFPPAGSAALIAAGLAIAN
jgi:hypothetical protein